MLLFGILVARWIAGWGLVTIHVQDAPLGKIIASIARQGHVRIESSLDLTKLVSLDVDRVTPAQAVDILSIRTDSSWRVVYLAAPTKADLNVAVISLRGSGKIEGWNTHYYPMPSFAGDDGQALDPRFLDLKIEGPDTDLSKLLDEAAQKGGVMTAAPTDWSPAAQRLPKENQVRKVLPALIGSVHGKEAEFFFLAERHRRGPSEAVQENDGGDQPPRFAAMNPDWRDQRALAQIQLLPPAERPGAKKELDDRKALFASMKNLAPEERRAKMREMMNNPDAMDKMADRMLLRQANQTAEQRINRAVNYLNNKAAAQSAQGR